MPTLFMILTLFALVAAVVALIRPSTFSKAGSAPPSRAKAAGICMAIAVAFFVGFGVTNDAEKDSPSVAVAAEKKPAIKGIDESLIPSLLVMTNEDFDTWLSGGDVMLGALHEKHFPSGGTVSARALAKSYEANEVAADNKYKDKALRVTGTVESINKDFTDNIYLSLQGSNMFGEVHARMDKDSAAEVSAMRKGQKVELLCTGRGMILTSAQLKDCKTVAKAAENAKAAEAKWIGSVLAGKPEKGLDNEKKGVGMLYVLLEADPGLPECLTSNPIDKCGKLLDAAMSDIGPEIKQRYSELASASKWPEMEI